MDVLDDMLIRLIGDGKSYEQMVNKAIGDTSKLEGSINKSSTGINGLTSSLAGFGSQVQGILGMIAGGLGFGSILGTLQNAIFKAGSRESTELAFEALIGNADRAKKALADLREFAVKTPFEVPQILDAAKMMLGYGATAEEIVPTMQRLGDVASALNIPMQSLAYLYGTLKSSGRVMTVDMRQFANRGIPIWLETAKVIGMVSKEATSLTAAQSAQLQEMTSKGKITFDMIEQAFKNMTSEGGRFFGFMEKQSHGFEGLISNLKDSLGLLLEEFGGEIIRGFDLKNIIKEVGVLAAAFANWFKNLDPNTKKFLFTLAGIISAVGVLTAAFLTLKAIMVGFGMVIATVGWPFLVVAGLITAAIGLWVHSVGGIGKAIEIAKAKFEEFWKVTEGVRTALGDLAIQIVESFTRTFSFILQVATDTFTGMNTSGATNWQELMQIISDGILQIQYEFLQMEKAYHETFRALGEEIGRAVFTMWQLVKAQLAIIETTIRLKKELGGGLTGGIGGLLFGGNTDAKDMPDELKNLPKTFEEYKAMVEKARATAKGGQLDDPLLKVLGDPKKAEKKGEEIGKGAGKGMRKEMEKQVQLLDAVIFGSAEHMRRLDEYMHRIGADTATLTGDKLGMAAGALGAAAGTGGGVGGRIGKELAKQSRLLESAPSRTAQDMCECFCKCLHENLNKQTGELLNDLPIDISEQNKKKFGDGMLHTLKARLPNFGDDFSGSKPGGPGDLLDDFAPSKMRPVDTPLNDENSASKLGEKLDRMIEILEGDGKKQRLYVEGAKVDLGL